MDGSGSTQKEKELLAEIIAHPDDDAVRLVYADLLQHDHDPQGELIVVQCALAGLGIRPGPASWDWSKNAYVDANICESAEMKRLRLREATLLKAHQKAWTKRVVELGGCGPNDCRLARGFLDHVSWHIKDDTPKDLDTLLIDVAPLARSLALVGSDHPRGAFSVQAFFGSACLARLEAFAYGSALSNDGDGLRLLLESRYLKGLRAFQGLLRHSVTQEVRMLSGASFFEQLEALDLSGSQLTQTMPSKLPRRLRQLHLRYCKLGPSSATTLGRCAELEGLEVLGLKGNALLSDGVTALLKSGYLGRSLRALDLHRNGLTTGNAQRILSSSTDVFPELRVLDLSKIQRGTWDPAVLAKAAGLPSLIELHLEGVLFDDDALTAFASSPLFSQLRVLDLRSNKITERGARALAASEACRNLRVLQLTSNSLLSPAGKRALADSPNLAHARVVTSPL